MRINEQLKILRVERGLSQTEFAEQLGITKEMVSQMERGVKNVSAATANSLNKIISETNIPISFLEAYKRGQRFSKIMDVLIKQGYTLKELRDNIFQTKGSDLSCMYIGIKPISKAVLAGLIDLKINIRYLDYGEQPIFIGEANTIIPNEVPYFMTNSTLDALFKIEKGNLSDIVYISTINPQIDFYISINLEDSSSLVSPKGKVIIGIKQTNVKNIKEDLPYLCRCSFDLFINRFDKSRQVVSTIPLKEKSKQNFSLDLLSSIFEINEIRYIAEG